jgi:hypothetical protein
MKAFIFSLLGALLLGGTARAETLFYGGDFVGYAWYADALANENDQMDHGNPYGAAVYQNFVVPKGQIWQVSSLFSNDLMSLAPRTAYWEIRTGVSEGDGGALVASGMRADAYHLKGTYGESTNTVSGLSVLLSPGVYWFTVVPDAPNQQGTSSNTNTFGLNSIGEQMTDEQYFNSPFYGYNFASAGDIGVFPIFSSGVMGTRVPEPSVLTLIASGLLAAAGVARRNPFKFR